jgi:hypothetical protein
MLSLTASTKTCKVEQGYAPRIQSDRFENPKLMICPVWTGFDNTNRAVCMDSYYTKSPGCNSPLDRVDVENYLRPNYMEYINLDAMGFRQNDDVMSCNNEKTNMTCSSAGLRTKNLENLNKITGNYGMSPNGSDMTFRCPNYSAEKAEDQRKAEAVQHKTSSASHRSHQ